MRASPGEAGRWLIERRDYRGDDCLMWPFSTNRQGYGSVLYGGKIMGAHRAMCFIAHGEPPMPDHEAAHYCRGGQLGCVNPRHIRWATTLENARDRIRHQTTTAKLSPDDIADVLRLVGEGEKQREIAKRFGVHEATISRVVHNKARVRIA